jgi:hypothetical protein
MSLIYTMSKMKAAKRYGKTSLPFELHAPVCCETWIDIIYFVFKIVTLLLMFSSKQLGFAKWFQSHHKRKLSAVTG